MIQQEFLIKHYKRAIDELNQSAYKGKDKLFYDLDTYRTSIGWKSMFNQVNSKFVQAQYNFVEDIIYISDKFKTLINKEKFDVKLIAAIKREIVSAYLLNKLKLDYDMIFNVNFFFMGVVEWINRNKPVGAEDIKINNRDKDLYNLYYKDIYTNHLDNEDFEDFDELISYLESRNREFKRQITKLENQVFEKSNEAFIYQVVVCYSSATETEIELETIYLKSPMGVITQNIININVAMYFEYKYVRTKCLDLINRLEEEINE